MFADYKILVLREYRRKLTANELPLNIVEPTLARLRNACLEACHERYDRRDERTLKAFFGEGTDKVALLQTIEIFGPGKFKALVNFMKEPTGNTDVKNIELLAWLIDFKPRPFEYGKTYDISEPGKPGMAQVEASDRGKERMDEIPTVQAGKRDNAETVFRGEDSSTEAGSKFKISKVIMAFAILLFAGIGIYWAVTKKPTMGMVMGPEACMFWTGDHYEQGPCSQKPGDPLSVALDPEKLAHFRKITKADTITTNAKGFVWYAIYGGNMEFYTADGFHPLDAQQPMRPITDNIIRKLKHSNQ